MEYKNQIRKLNNGAVILNEISIEPKIRLITAHYSTSNDPYVIWYMNTWDRSTYWGHYFNTLVEAYEYYTNKWIKKLSIDMQDYKSFSLSCCKYDTKNDSFVNCSICDNWDSFCLYAKTHSNINKLITIHYLIGNATIYGYWIGNRYNIPFFNEVEDKFGKRTNACNYIT